MSTSSTSFLSPAPDNNPAPFLFSEEALQRIEVLEREALTKGEWTGERLRREAPRLVEGVLRLTALDVTQEDIAFALQMSVNSVRRIQTECAVSVDGYKERLGRGLRKVTSLTIHALAKKLEDPDQVAKMKVGELAIVAGITIEKEQLVSGGPTQRIEHTTGEPPIEAFNDYIASLPSADVTPVQTPAQGMGCGAGRNLGKSAGSAVVEGELSEVALGDAGADLGDEGADLGGRDTGSEGAVDAECAALPVEKAIDTACDAAQGSEGGQS